MTPDQLSSDIRRYWNVHIHDQKIATHPVGTPEFFAELEAYRFDKLRYLPILVDFAAYRGRQLLEVGCGAGTDLVRFARGGAVVTGIDFSASAVDLARQNFQHQGLPGTLLLMDGEALGLADESFDVVYAHGVLQYTANPQRMIHEIHRVLRPGGQAILMVYNRYSWLPLLSLVMQVELEHGDAPGLRLYSSDEFRHLLAPFATARIIPERFPVPTQLHRGLKARLYNGVFVRAFQVLPRSLVQPTGWHLMAFVSK